MKNIAALTVLPKGKRKGLPKRYIPPTLQRAIKRGTLTVRPEALREGVAYELLLEKDAEIKALRGALVNLTDKNVTHRRQSMAGGERSRALLVELDDVRVSLEVALTERDDVKGKLLICQQERELAAQVSSHEARAAHEEVVRLEARVQEQTTATMKLKRRLEDSQEVTRCLQAEIATLTLSAEAAQRELLENQQSARDHVDANDSLVSRIKERLSDSLRSAELYRQQRNEEVERTADAFMLLGADLVDETDDIGRHQTTQRYVSQVVEARRALENRVEELEAALKTALQAAPGPARRTRARTRSVDEPDCLPATGQAKPVILRGADAPKAAIRRPKKTEEAPKKKSTRTDREKTPQKTKAKKETPRKPPASLDEEKPLKKSTRRAARAKEKTVNAERSEDRVVTRSLRRSPRFANHREELEIE
ncbi:MAG: uncharacterized protein KVP18_001716 [Porospora cf. gigantea A]|nr:MAG: hypothetical protein KVP18_001716 [Porospora cf. gigantea A]